MPETVSTNEVERDSTARSASDTSLAAIAEFKKFEAEHPELFYRLMRYEVLIGYPDHGEMGRRRDKVTGKVYYLPWPENE